MRSLLKKIQKALELPQHPSLGIHLRGLQVSGLWFMGRRSLKTRLWYYFYISFGCLYLLTQYYSCYLLGSEVFNSLQDISITLQYTTAALKALSLIIGNNNFHNIIQAISKRELEELSLNNNKTLKIMKSYLKFSHTLTYFYCIMGYITVVMLSASPLIKYVASGTYREELASGNASYVMVLNSWLPFETDTNPGYAISVVVHSAVNLGFGLIIAPYDSLFCAVMVFFKGQLEILKVKCSSVFGDEEEVLSEVEIRRRLSECHTIHNYLIKYAKMFNAILSPVMSVYLVTCSIMICASIAQLTQANMESYDRLHIIDYMVSVNVQLFVYCWFTHQVYYASNSIPYSLFESKWWKHDLAHFRHDVILLAGKLDSNAGFIFTAGPLFVLNLPTFINVLRGAYSFYTLIARVENEITN